MKLLGALAALVGGYFVSTMGFAGLAFPSGARILSSQLPNKSTIVQFLIAGQNEATPAIPVVGMLGTDVLVSVIVLTTAAAIASAAQRPLTDFRCQDAVLLTIANPVNNTNNQYVITVQRPT